jgi:3-(3-hydroxy-phenyl)propionate hydroxylase
MNARAAPTVVEPAAPTDAAAPAALRVVPRANPVYPFRRPPELDGAAARRPVIVVGAGPVGLVAAIDLALRGIPALVLDDDDTVSVGSRAICYAKRTLEILDRLGCAESLVRKGVQWHVGRVFFRDAPAYQFDLLPEAGHRRPAFVNLQQYHFEEGLVARADEVGVDLRWRNRVVAVEPRGDGVALQVETPAGAYRIEADWLIVADGARSPVRRMLGLEAAGQVFHDRFLIADIRMRSDFPTERWFWFDPPFHPGQSVLLHRQADDVWRVDFQLGWHADPEEERKPERIAPRLRAMLGPAAQFDLEWASVYTFQCRRMERFRHDRVLFAGDAAHVVSPFGARGANSGIQDVDNLVWKLALVLQGAAPHALLDTYDAERVPAADENIRHSTRATDFITPKSKVSLTFRNAVLELARDYPFARKLVNSGRLSVPTMLSDSPLNTPDAAVPADAFAPHAAPAAPGCAALDAPVRGPRGAWLLDHIGPRFTLLVFGTVDPGVAAQLGEGRVACEVVCVNDHVAPPAQPLRDVEGHAARRYDARPGTAYLFRPDQHVCARWRKVDAAAVRAAIARACAVT